MLQVWNSDLDIVLTPLDATNEIPITKEMLLRYVRELPGHGKQKITFLTECSCVSKKTSTGCGG